MLCIKKAPSPRLVRPQKWYSDASSGARTLDTLIKSFDGVWFMDKCDFNCFECEFPDCIFDTDSSNAYLDAIISDEIDSILFPVDSSVPPAVPDYRLYDFISSEDIPYNPKWKSQAKWREYYRSRARGNRKDYINWYYNNHKDEISFYGRKYYQKHREKVLDYQKKYYQEHKEEFNANRRKYYKKNKELLHLKANYRKWAFDVLREFYDALWKIL